MPFSARVSPPVAAAAAAAGAVLAAVALRRYLSSPRHRPSDRATMLPHRSSSGAATLVVVAAGKSAEDQQILASAARSLSLGDGEGGGEITVSLASDGGFDVGAYMDVLRARRFGRWMLWSPRLPSTQDLMAQ
jgi:biotin---protein ligase